MGLKSMTDETNELEQRLAACEAEGNIIDHIGVLEKLTELHPDNLNYRFMLGKICQRAGRSERAERLIRSCLEAGDSRPEVHTFLANALNSLGRSDEAAEHYKQLVQCGDPYQAGVGYWSLANLKNYRFSDLELADLRGRAYLDEEEDQPGRDMLLFALAAGWEQKGRTEKAFLAMAEANLLHSKMAPFRADLYSKFVKSVIEKFNSPVKLSPIDGSVPIFIVGMPRSGTTLVEQILASHSEVEATNELPYLSQIVVDLERRGGFALALNQFNKERQIRYAEQYLAKAKAYAKLDRGFFIDKSPSNFLRIGLIKTLFPNAKIINVFKDPLDNAMGLYKMYFGKGNDFSFSLDGIVYYWQGYLTIMKHWDDLYPGEVFHLSYEALAKNPDEKIPEILEYCDLPMEEGCLRFYESDRAVFTPSANQVRKPISTKNIGSGLKYAEFIEPVLPKLALIKHKAKEIFGV